MAADRGAGPPAGPAPPAGPRPGEPSTAAAATAYPTAASAAVPPVTAEYAWASPATARLGSSATPRAPSVCSAAMPSSTASSTSSGTKSSTSGAVPAGQVVCRVSRQDSVTPRPSARSVSAVGRPCRVVGRSAVPTSPTSAPAAVSGSCQRASRDQRRAASKAA